MGEKLFLKGDRCVGPKCAFIRRGYPPGVHGKRKRRGGSEFGMLLKEKQKLRFTYGLDDKDVRRYTREAISRKELFRVLFLQLLERRLDNVVFRLGVAVSRRMARQVVLHGHVLVNGKVISVPSYRVVKGDVVMVQEKSLGSGFLGEWESRIKKGEPPAWLSLDKTKKEATVTGLPEVDDLQTQFDVTKIKEFYSR